MRDPGPGERVSKTLSTNPSLMYFPFFQISVKFQRTISKRTVRIISGISTISVISGTSIKLIGKITGWVSSRRTSTKRKTQWRTAPVPMSKNSARNTKSLFVLWQTRKSQSQSLNFMRWIYPEGSFKDLRTLGLTSQHQFNLRVGLSLWKGMIYSVSLRLVLVRH